MDLRKLTCAHASRRPGAWFKDVVEKLAADNGVVFMPTGSSRPDGSRIYHFGTVQITVDIKDNLVYLHDKEAGWQAVTVEDVLAAGREK